jgi:hypothetical protein
VTAARELARDNTCPTSLQIGQSHMIEIVFGVGRYSGSMWLEDIEFLSGICKAMLAEGNLKVMTVEVVVCDAFLSRRERG